MKSPFYTLSPGWEQIPNIKAHTILATSPNNERITFSGESDSALKSKEYLTQWTGIDNIHWLHQVHGDVVLTLPDAHENMADAVVTGKAGVICAVRTADCLPVVFASKTGTLAGVAHAGWKGLKKEILFKTIEALNEKPENVLAWIGPAIAQTSYEVGPELRDTFMETDPLMDQFFKPGKEDRYFADLAGIARFQLERLGIQSQDISGGTWDTFTGNEFHSFRRDGSDSGRMVTMVWMDDK